MLTAAVDDIVGVERGESSESPGQYGGFYRIGQPVGIRTCKETEVVECQHDDVAVTGAPGLRCIGNVASEGTALWRMLSWTGSATTPAYETERVTLLQYSQKLVLHWTTSE